MTTAITPFQVHVLQACELLVSYQSIFSQGGGGRGQMSGQELEKSLFLFKGKYSETEIMTY